MGTGAAILIGAGQLGAQARSSAPPRAPIPYTVTDSGPNKPVRGTIPCVVQRVSDGDTINCERLGRVRLIGIDAPEVTQTAASTASVAALRRLLPVGARVDLEPDVSARDQYQRVLAYVWTNGRMVNWHMIRSGWATLLTVPPNVQYVSAFKGAEQRARSEKLGLWKTGGFACLPADHRKQRC